jgi:hypothetical protein
MPTPPYCPSCFVKLEPDMRACPNCPMSFPEEDGPAKATENPLKQSRYYQFVMPALFFAGLGLVVWWLASGLFRLGEDNANTPQVNVLNQGAAANERTLAAGLTPAVSTAAASSYEGSATVSVSPTDDSPVAVSDVPVKRVRPVKEWKLRGTVYDLATLKPLAGCQLTFSDTETNRNIQTRTNSEGRYKTVVPSLPERGYAVKAEKNGYSPNYLDPGVEGVRAMSGPERKELAKGLVTTLTVTPAMVQGVSAAPLVTDFFLAPRP